MTTLYFYLQGVSGSCSDCDDDMDMEEDGEEEVSPLLCGFKERMINAPWESFSYSVVIQKI